MPAAVAAPVHAAPAPVEKAAPAEKGKAAAAPAKPKEAAKPAPVTTVAAVDPAQEQAAAADAAFLYDFKTKFMNSTDRAAVTEELLNTYDKQQFSFWFGKYDKHHSEGKELIATNNLLTNFAARVTDIGASKHLLAVYGIYGDEPDLNLPGEWFWRGLTHLKEMEQHPVNEFVKWEKLDTSNPEHKAKILSFWKHSKSEEGTVEGAKVLTVKVLK